MSYYYALTPEQVNDRKVAFETVYCYDEHEGCVMKTHMPQTQELNLIADYIGYLIYRSNCKQRKYHEKELNVINYLTFFQKADRVLAGFITTIGMDSIKTINPLAHRMMERFIKMDDRLVQ